MTDLDLTEPAALSMVDQVGAALRDAYKSHSEYQAYQARLLGEAERLRRELAGVEANVIDAARLEREAAAFVAQVFDHYRTLVQQTRPTA